MTKETLRARQKTNKAEYGGLKRRVWLRNVRRGEERGQWWKSS